MPGPLPAKFARLTFKPREFRPASVNLTGRSVFVTALVSLNGKLQDLAAKVKGSTFVPVIVPPGESAESKAIQQLNEQVQEISAAYEQQTRQLIDRVRDCQQAINDIIEHLTP